MNIPTTMPDLAILDGDWIAYTAACWADNEGFEYLEDRLAYDIRSYTPKGCSQVLIAFSCSRADNYRRDFWPVYKIHRDNQEAPEFLKDAIEYLEANYNCTRVDRLEADDLIGLAVSNGKAVGVAIDKDMRTCPGWHWNPRKEDAPVIVTADDAFRFFCEQLVTGDTTDGIYGCIGKGKAHFDKKIAAVYPSDRWIEKIMVDYADALASPGKRYVEKVENIQHELGFTDPREYFLAQARCLRILQGDDYDKTTGKVRPWTPEIM